MDGKTLLFCFRGLAVAVFSIRAEGLLNNQLPATAASALSGLLIGAELAAARAYWLGQRIVMIGNETLARAYAQALAGQGVPVETADATEMTIAGLCAHRASLREHAS